MPQFQYTLVMEKLIQQILDGDLLAVQTFYKKYSPKITSYIQQKVGSQDAYEIAQDVFLEAFDSLALFEGRSSIATWLYTIAHNKIVDFYRKKKIKSVLLSQFPFLQPISQEIVQPEFQFEKNKIRDRIEATFHTISFRYRQILKRHYEDNISVKQIAIELNLSHKATESLLYRARQAFIKSYAED